MSEYNKMYGIAYKAVSLTRNTHIKAKKSLKHDSIRKMSSLL